MPHEGEKITGVRDLTEDDIVIVAPFPNGVDTVTGLELESGAVIFPSRDEEGNGPGEWSLTRGQLADAPGSYIVGFRHRSNPQATPGGQNPLLLVISDEQPVMDDGSVEAVPGNTIPIEPRGHGAGPAAWFVRDDSDDPEAPDPAETPTPDEVFEMHDNDELPEGEDFFELLERAEAAHTDSKFYTIC